jgi:hypothetical protein
MDWWDGMKYIIDIVQPVYKLLRFADREKMPNLCEVVYHCHTRFYKENRMHLTCAPGSFYTHMIDKTRVIPLQ